MKTFFFTCLFLLSLQSFSSEFHHPYYPSSVHQKIWSMNLKNEDMKNLLRNVLNFYHVKKEGKPDTIFSKCPVGKRCYKKKRLEYFQAKKYLFGQLHLQIDGNGYYIKDVYCNKIYDSNTPNIGEIGPMTYPNHNVVNCEHTWPKSRFSAKNYEEQKTDLHHLFPTQMQANSIRSSYRFGEVSKPTNNSLCNTSNFGIYLNHPDKSFSDFFFEPPMGHRGNVARALFYFSVKYKLKITLDEEYYLRKWHIQDPVDENEIDRNEAINQIQNNRNPFIDYPFLIDLISDF